MHTEQSSPDNTKNTFHRYCSFRTVADKPSHVLLYRQRGRYVFHVSTRCPPTQEPPPLLPPDDLWRKNPEEVQDGLAKELHYLCSSYSSPAEILVRGGPYDGHTFVVDNAYDALSLIDALRLDHYLVPDTVVEALEQESRQP